MRKSVFLNFISILAIMLLGGAKMAKAQQKPPIFQQGQIGIFSSSPVQNQPKQPASRPRVQVPEPTSCPTDNVSKAIKTAKDAKVYFVPGKVWVQRTPTGELIIKGAILYEGIAVGAIEFDPFYGTALPKGYNPHRLNQTVSLDVVKNKLAEIVSNLEVLNGAEYREPEYCFVVPLAYCGKIVAHIKVYCDGVHIVPDYPVSQEMEAFGR